MLEMIILGVFSTVIIWLPNVYALIAFRFITGIGFGGFYNSAFVYSKPTVLFTTKLEKKHHILP